MLRLKGYKRRFGVSQSSHSGDVVCSVCGRKVYSLLCAYLPGHSDKEHDRWMCDACLDKYLPKDESYHE